MAQQQRFEDRELLKKEAIRLFGCREHENYKATVAPSRLDSAPMIRTFLLTALLMVFAGTSQAFAWGCDGHQAVALIAERLLSPATVAAINAILAASPVDPAIKPYCPPLPLDPMADAATWADDNRTLEPATGGWHFINFPLSVGGNTSGNRKYCPRGNCVVDAIVAQYRTLTTTTDAKVKGNALRYIVHFVGDVHQPLHSLTNGDRGGNCLPITYYGMPPQEDERLNWRPNLHSIWDDGTVRRLMTTKGLADSRSLADYLVAQAPLPRVSARKPSADRIASWTRDGAKLARTVAYGKLPVTPPLEPAAAAYSLASCDDNNHVGRRMATLHEQIAESYEQAAVPVIVQQLRLAGERLAAVLKAAFPTY